MAERFRHAMLGVLLFLVLASIYLLLYRGHPLSIDEISTFDSIESFVQHGTLARTIEFYRAPRPDGVPFLTPLYEPLQIIAASPFYLFAQPFEAFGQFHTVYLLNIFTTALTAVSLYAIALWNRYRVQTALLAAFVFGVATLALPYSRWLFREPLMAFFVLWAFALALNIRQRIERQQPVYGRGLLLVGAVMGMLLAKQVGVLFVPGLLLCLMPPLRLLRRYLPVIGVLVVSLAVFLIALAIINPDFGDDRYNFTRWLNPANLGLNYMLESMLGYQISPARSFWLYSPVLLLAFPGVLLLRRTGWRWLAVGLVVSLLISSAAYGALRMGVFWSGGWNWGPRYMLPLIPVWMLFLLPVFEAFPRAARWQQVAVVLLIMLSFGMQMLGIAVPFTDYYNQLPPELTTPTSWLLENWSVQQSAILYHLRNFSLTGFDSAWRYADPPFLIPLLTLAVIALSLALGWSLIRDKVRHRELARLGAALLLGAFAVNLLLGLLILRYDRRYIGSREDVFELVDLLNTRVDRERDVVFLNGNEYMIMFMNWFKSGALFVTLPDSATVPATESTPAVDWGAAHYDRVWLVTSEQPTQAPHALQRHLASTLYPVDTIRVSLYANASMFTSLPQVLMTAVEVVPPPVFDARLSLVGAELPQADTFRAGELVPLSLTWMPLQPIDRAYHVSIQVLDADGQLVAQRDSAPLGGVADTNTWAVGNAYRDNYTVLLPDALVGGRYHVNVVVYEVSPLNRVPVAQADQPVAEDSVPLFEFTIPGA